MGQRRSGPCQTDRVDSPAVILLALALVIAAFDWWAVARQVKAVEYVCKPAAAVGFLITALAVDPVDHGARLWMVAALVFCLAGDVFLMLPRDAFLAGLGSFAVAQIFFTVSFGLREPTATRALVGLVIVAVGASVLARRFVAALRRVGAGSMVPAILIYVTVISAMVVSAIAGGTAIGIIGAVLFLVSDSLIAEERFVNPRRWQRLTIIVTYHLALTGLVVGLV